MLPSTTVVCLHCPTPSQVVSRVLQLLLIDKHHLHVWDLVRDRFVARKRISQQPLIAIFKASSKGEFGVVSGSAVDMWRVEQDLNYRIVLGGHTGPVIAVHPVNGAPVSGPSCFSAPSLERG